MRLNIHAGHNPDGKIGCGAVGIGYESTMNREVKDKLINMLREAGHTVHDCTVNDGKSANDVLVKIVEKCNSHEVDLDISIHHNASTKKDTVGDGKLMGSAVYAYKPNNVAAEFGRKVLNELYGIGYPNLGIWDGSRLYVLKHTKAPAMLIECCFVDDRDDMNKWNAERIAAAIMKGITGDIPSVSDNTSQEILAGKWYKVQTGAFKSKENAERQLKALNSLGYQDAFIQEY